MAKIKRPDNTKCCRAYEAFGSLTYCWWECKYSVAPLENSLASYHNIKHTHGIRPRNSTLGYFPKEGETYVHTKTCV